MNADQVFFRRFGMLNVTMAKWSLVAVFGILAIGLIAPSESQARGAKRGCEEACEACDEPCIHYHHHCTLLKTCRCCECCEPQKAVMTVTDPCCCDRTAEIPICLPGCCEGEPRVCESVCLGRGVVEFEWCCGFRVRVVFQKCGDIAVHTYGR